MIQSSSLTLFFLLLLRVAQAQVSVQVLVPPPYSPYLYDYQEQFADRNAIILTNTTDQNVTVMLRGELKGRNNGIRVYTNSDYRPAKRIELEPRELQRFTLAEDNQDYLDRKNLEVAGVDNATRTQILTTGLLPPGSYDLCILAYRYVDGQPVGTPFQGCAFLNIAYLEPPRLIQPLCGREVLIRPDEPNQTVFSWNPPVGNNLGTPLVYDFYLVKVPPGQNPNDAIDNVIDRRVGNPFIERDLTTTFYNYGLAEPPLTEGQYAWRVVARDPDGRTVIQNQGRSDYCQFTARSVAETEPKKPVIPPGLMRATNFIASEASTCKDVPAPGDKTPVADNYLNQNVKLGKFDLTIDAITLAQNAYTGNGRIRWNGVPVRVTFSNVQINASKQVIAGSAQGVEDAFKMPGIELGSADLNSLQNLEGDVLKTYVSNLKNNMFDQAKSSVAVPLPLGYETGSGLIGINYMRFTPTGADMGLVFTMEMPEANAYLALAGAGICMAPDKFIPNNALLYLLKDFKVPSIPLTFLKSNLAAVNPTGTFAELTVLDGLKRVHGELALNLGSDILKLDDGNGNVKPGDVTATLKTDFTKWADWIAEVQLPPAFALAPLAGFTLKGVSVQYDHSDLRDPAGFAPPAEYKREAGPTFKGIYMTELQVMLPKSFANRNGQRVGFAAKGCLFANGQFTGRLAPVTKPLLGYNDGSLGNWGLSIDEFEVLIVRNTFTRGSMNGKLQFPISEDYFTYTTTLRDNFKDLQFVVKPKAGGYNVPLWAASINIAEGSSIKVGLQNNNPVMDMDLNGDLTINSSKMPKAVSLVLPNMSFEQLIVTNQSKPGASGNGGVFVNPGNWELVGGLFKKSPPPPGAQKGGGPLDPQQFGGGADEWTTAAGNEGGLVGFPFEIAKPKVVVNSKGFGMELGGYLSLGETSANIANASGFVQILGTIKLENGRPKPAFAGVYPTRFGIDGSMGGGTVKASIELYSGDATYGDGFRGAGTVVIPALVGVAATVQFGKVDGYFYAYTDASVVLGAGGIPIAPPTPLVLNGLKGGFYYNMTPKNWVMPTSIENKKNPDTPPPGYSNSGVRYVPRQGGWGIKAGVYLAMADPHLMISLVEVEASFNGTALSRFSLTGQANVIDADGSLLTPSDAMVTARAEFVVDVPRKSYDFSIDLSAKFFVASVEIPVRAHFDPVHYHVKLGDPFGKRMTATILDIHPDLGVVSLTAKLVANAYVAFGNDLPGMPDLPRDVEEFLGKGEERMNSSEADTRRQAEFNRVANSGGSAPVHPPFRILLGAEVEAKLEVGVAIITIKAGGNVGFDAALGYDLECEGGRKIEGLYGWYGQAQLYAYLYGSINIYVDVFLFKGNVKLAALEAGAVLRGGLPSPTWAAGKVRARGQVLNGLVKFDKSVEMAFGDKCVPVYTGDPLASVIIIEELFPTGDKVSTTATAGAVFNVSMNKEISLELPDNSIRKYEFYVSNYSLNYTDSSGQRKKFEGLSEPVWSNDNQLMQLPINSGQLASTRPHTLSVSAQVTERKPDGASLTVLDATGKPRTETKSINFTTDKQPDYIRVRDVAFQYPMRRQLYFLKGQVPRGVIAGKLPNEALTKPGYRYEAVFVPEEPGPSLRVPFTYQPGWPGSGEASSSRVVFAIPAGLQNEKTYRLELHRIKNVTTASSMFQGGVKQGRAELSSGSVAMVGTSSIRRNSLTGNFKAVTVDYDKILYSFAFRTSRHNTFAEKVAGLSFAPTSYTNAKNPSRSDYLTFELEPTQTPENFEDLELNGYKLGLGTQPPLLQPRPLEPIDKSHPHEAWVADNVYLALMKVRTGLDLSFEKYPEMNAGGWILNYPVAAMQSRRKTARFGQLVAAGVSSSKGSVTLRGAAGAGGNGVSAAGVSAKAGAAITASSALTQSSPVGTLVRGINNRSSALITVTDANSFTINDAPQAWYKFFVQRDLISYYDWQAVDQLGSLLFAAREDLFIRYPGLKNVAELKVLGFSFVHSQDIIANSPTLLLSTTYKYPRNWPDAWLDRYPVRPGTLDSDRVFKPRESNSKGSVVLRYVPYLGGPKQDVRKDFQFGTTIIAPRTTPKTTDFRKR